MDASLPSCVPYPTCRYVVQFLLGLSTSTREKIIVGLRAIRTFLRRHIRLFLLDRALHRALGKMFSAYDTPLESIRELGDLFRFFRDLLTWQRIDQDEVEEDFALERDACLSDECLMSAYISFATVSPAHSNVGRATIVLPFLGFRAMRRPVRPVAFATRLVGTDVGDRSVDGGHDDDEQG